MSINLFDLTGKVALITGAVHGLGMAMAKGLGNAGATIVVNNNSEDKLTEAVNEYKACGLNAHGYVFDVTNEKAVIEAIAKIEAEVGPIDILVNNAGIIKRTPLQEMEVADFEQVIKVYLGTLQNSHIKVRLLGLSNPYFQRTFFLHSALPFLKA